MGAPPCGRRGAGRGACTPRGWCAAPSLRIAVCVCERETGGERGAGRGACTPRGWCGSAIASHSLCVVCVCVCVCVCQRGSLWSLSLSLLSLCDHRRVSFGAQACTRGEKKGKPRVFFLRVEGPAPFVRRFQRRGDVLNEETTDTSSPGLVGRIGKVRRDGVSPAGVCYASTAQSALHLPGEHLRAALKSLLSGRCHGRQRAHLHTGERG